jgi:hypothetical protein
MKDEWTKVISGDRLVKFTCFDLPAGTAFMTAQIASHEVVYSIISKQVERPFSRVGVEGRFGYELRPISNGIVKLRVFALNPYAFCRVPHLKEQQYLGSPSTEVSST